MSSNLPKIKAKLTLYSTENGGRQSGIKTGYRPNHVFEYKDNGTDFKAGYMGTISFDENHIIEPSKSGIVSVEFIGGQNIDRFINLGRIWWIHEGKRKVGEAIITEIETE